MPSRPRPEHLGLDHSTHFRDQGVVDAYHLRPPYPEETFDILESLITDEPSAVLDVGSGSGDIARRLVKRVERVDAVDFSLPMIEKGKTMPDGDHPNLRWIFGPAEEVSLNPPYALITGGQSMHWMDWDVILPRFRDMLTSHGYLAVLSVEGSLVWAEATAWDKEVGGIIKRYSTSPKYQNFDMIEEWTVRGLFEKVGEAKTAPVSFVQSLDDYIEAFHSMSSLSREHMGQQNAEAFDNEVRDVVSKYIRNGLVEKRIYGTVVWGRPLTFERDTE
jgi:ubiquinone/menaquinone biosynthesis C-methylase UbiE